MIVNDLFENVAGHGKVSTKPGAGRNAGKRVNDYEKIKESVGKFNIGDPVIIAGPVEYEGKTGEIVQLGHDGDFVVVDLYNHGRHSFHSADVAYNDYADEEDVAEGASTNLEQLIQQYEDMVENVYGMIPGSRQRRAIAKRDALEARIEALPGGKAALEKWARSYNDSFGEGVLENLGLRNLRNTLGGIAKTVYSQDQGSQSSRRRPTADQLARRRASAELWDKSKKKDVAEGEEQGLDNKYRRTAKAMIRVYNTNPEVKARVDASPEPFRAMVYNTGVVKNPERLDGTTHYHKLVDELESIFYYGREGVAEGSEQSDHEAYYHHGPDAAAVAKSAHKQAKQLSSLHGSEFGVYVPNKYVDPNFKNLHIVTNLKDVPEYYTKQGVAEAGNKPVEKYRLGMGDNRTARELKTQMQGASDEFVKHAAKDVGPFHSRVAKMQGKLAKSELRNRAADHDRLATGTNEGEKIGNMDADKFDAAMDRLKKLAGAGPLKTVWDPARRVYRNVPTAVQPKK